MDGLAAIEVQCYLVDNCEHILHDNPNLSV